MISAERAAPEGPLELVIEGAFDPDEARCLHDILRRVAPSERVRVDFHEVRAFHDLAVAMLASDLAAPYGGNVELVGLSEHHHRVLRYLDPRLG